MNMFSRASEVIYAQAAQRIDEEIAAKNKPNKFFYAADEPLVGRIRKNERVPKKNPYLISPGAVESLIFNLGYEDDGGEHRLFWGGDEGIHTYNAELFFALCGDILYGDPTEVQNELRTLLMEYIPYGKWYAYFRNCLESYGSGKKWSINGGLCIQSGIDGEILIRNLAIAEKKAITRLYTRRAMGLGEFTDKTGGEHFYDALKAFTYETYGPAHINKKNRGKNKGFKQLPKRLAEFAENEFLRVLWKMRIGDKQLGERAYELIVADVAELWNTINAWLPKHSDREHETAIMRARISTTRKYIDALAKNQMDLEERYHPQMYKPDTLPAHVTIAPPEVDVVWPELRR